MPKSIPGITPAWSDYLTCILLHMLLPLLPLFVEFMLLGAATPSTLAIAAAMYVMSIGVSSENKAMFSLCNVLGLTLSTFYGLIASLNAELAASAFASCSIFIIFVFHACERYNRHVAQCRPFLEFHRGGRSE